MSDIIEIAARRRAGWGPLGVLMAAAALFLLFAPPARAHEGGIELTVSPAELASGGQVTVSGEGFAPNATIGLNLTGPGGDADLGSTTTNEEGDFSQTLTIPGAMVPGLYLIRTEGGPEASVEVSLSAMPGMAAADENPTPERDRGTAWKTTVTVVLLLVAALGGALTLPRRRAVVRRPAA